MAESIYNHYHLSNPYDFDLTNETPYFGFDRKINQNLKDTVRVLIDVSECEDVGECDCDFTDSGHVSYKLRDHMVQLTIQAVCGPLLSNYQAFLLHPRSTNLINWATFIESESHRKTKSRAEYFRVMVVNIYKVVLELTDRRAHRVGQARNGTQGVQGVHGVQDVQGAQGVQGVHGVQDVHHIAQGVPCVHSNHRLEEPNYKQIPVERKFVRSSNFKSGYRQKFFIFFDTHQVKEDEDLTQKPKNVSQKHLARGGSWIKTNMETYQKHDTSYLYPELSTGRLRKKQEPKRLLNIPRKNEVEEL
jgi:hypothetical protein